MEVDLASSADRQNATSKSNGGLQAEGNRTGKEVGMLIKGGTHPMLMR